MLAARSLGALLRSPCTRRACAARGLAPPRAPRPALQAGAPRCGGPLAAPRAPPGLPSGRRGAATRAPEAEEGLLATADVEVAKLGGAVAARVRSSGRFAARSVGARAAYNCVKAIVNAADYLRQDEGAPPGRALEIRLAEQAADVQDEQAKRTVMVFRGELREGPREAADGAGRAAKELIVGAATNAGRAAAAIAAVVRQGPGARALVRAMGSNAVHQALISTALAQKYLDNDGLGVQLVVEPGFEDMNSPPKGVKPMKQLVLRISRLGK